MDDDTSFTINAMAKNTSSSFYYSLVNSGSKNATTTSEIDVRRVETLNDSWESGTPIDLSKQNESYEPVTDNITYFIPDDENATAIGNTFFIYIKDFTASYPSGTYKSQLSVNYTCEGSGNFSFKEYRYFRIIESDGTGSGVEQDDFPSDDPYPSESNVTTNESGNFTEPTTGGNQSSDFEEPANANQTGNFTTNTTIPAQSNRTVSNSTNSTTPDLGGNSTSELERPRDANQTGNFSTNVTIPADANRTGEQSNRTVEGNNDNPGRTPEPEPEPEPTPGNSPDPGESQKPRIAIDVEPVNQTYTAYQGQFAPAKLKVDNIGNRSVSDITLVPEIGAVRPDWQVRNATIANLSVGETVSRDVFVRPPEDQPPGTYLVPVRAENPDSQLDLDYFTVKVNQSEFVPRVEITEAPRTVSIQTGASQTLPILVENPGRRNLTNVTARLQNAEDCGNITADSVSRVRVNGTASLEVSINASSRAQSCDATLIVSSSDGAYSFSDVSFDIRPQEGLIPEEQKVPFIAIAWTFVLAAYAVMRKRYELNSSLVKIPFILLLMGETVIILYMLVNYYGVMSVSFLPF